MPSNRQLHPAPAPWDGRDGPQREATDRRRALLTATLGFLQLRQEPTEVATLRRYLDSWRGLGDVVVGLNARGYHLELRQFARGWRANLYPTGTAHSIVVASAWKPTPWRAVQQAAWGALKGQAGT
jgi:hypothetical protein